MILNTYVKKVLEDYVDLLPHAWPRGILEGHFRNLLETSHYVKNFKDTKVPEFFTVSVKYATNLPLYI